MATNNGLMGLRRGVALLARLSRCPDGLSFGQVQAAMGDLPAPTLSRLLKVMADEGLIRKDPASGVYATGTAARALARGLLGQVTAEELVRPVVRSLAGATGQSAAYCEPGTGAFSFLVTENMPDSFHYISPGKRNTRVVRHGFGQVCLAHADDRTVKSVVANSDVPLPLGTEAFKARLGRIREDGVFVEAGEDRDACIRIAAPVFDGPGGPFRGALGITVLAMKLTAGQSGEYVHQVRTAAQGASALFGS